LVRCPYPFQVTPFPDVGKPDQQDSKKNGDIDKRCPGKRLGPAGDVRWIARDPWVSNSKFPVKQFDVVAQLL
jgi:hypothetical protein